MRSSVTAEVSILLSAPSASTVSALGIYSFPGTAASGTDYTATGPLDISFAPGETVKTISVTIAGDYIDEADESFSLILPDTKGATRGTSETTVFIQDNDTAQRP